MPAFTFNYFTVSKPSDDNYSDAEDTDYQNGLDPLECQTNSEIDKFDDGFCGTLSKAYSFFDISAPLIDLPIYCERYQQKS